MGTVARSIEGLPSRQKEASISLDTLGALDAEELARLYQGARVPALSELDGDLRGRMLVWPSLRGLPVSLLRAAAGQEGFPWRGKSFHWLGEGRGAGINRVLGDRTRLFPFVTFVGPSRAGRFDAVQLDYDRPENPALIRAIKDEIREVSPGVYLGQAWLRMGGRERLVLWFGLERRP